MRRRDFLVQVSVAALGGAGCSVKMPGDGASVRQEGRMRGRKVVVVGAGLAGLAAGYELVQAGHEVTILEARSHPGGRVHTLRELFSDRLYAEEGATFVPDNHDLTLKYVHLFDLPLDPVVPRVPGRLYYVRGRPLRVTHGARVPWPFDLTPEEDALGLAGILQKYLFSALDELGDVTAPGWPGADVRLEQYDRMSGAEFLRSRGASPGAVDLLRVGYLDLLGDGVESYSALAMLRDVALQRTEKQSFTIRGGTDLLPRAFAARLTLQILYESPVVRIEPGQRAAAVVVRRERHYQRLEADQVVCAVPFSILKGIEVSPPFSPQKQAAIQQLPYTSIARVYLQCRRKFWVEQRLYNSATTDLPIKHIFEPTMNQPGLRGILACDTAGTQARRITALLQDDRISFALTEMERVYPGLREEVEQGASKCWDEDEWARGAYAWFRPGQMGTLLPHITRPEGHVHFAGEHASPWIGWMQGALHSGIRVAQEIEGG